MLHREIYKFQAFFAFLGHFILISNLVLKAKAYMKIFIILMSYKNQLQSITTCFCIELKKEDEQQSTVNAPTAIEPDGFVLSSVISDATTAVTTDDVSRRYDRSN